MQMYRVKRPILWFWLGQEISYWDMKKWYTSEAITALIESGFIEDIGYTEL